MADSTPLPPPPSGSSSAPPPPTASGAPGYDSSSQSATHMPPPPIPPLSIPQNTNPVPTAMASPMNNGQNIMSPQSAGSYIRRAAPEPNKRALYVGGLDVRVTEEVLKQIFETSGHVLNVKIIPDKNVNAKGLNYGFIDFDDPAGAERAMQTLNGRKVMGQEIRVNWAYQSNNTNKEDTSNHYHIFVGDLSNEVNDEILTQAFSAFGPVSEARVMWDMKTGRSRGYGFVAFRDRADAEKAIGSMDGEWLGSRAIRCNWANQKGQPSLATTPGGLPGVATPGGMAGQPGMPYAQQHPPFPTGGMSSYEQVLGQSPTYQSTCYIGNLTPYTTQNDLVPLFMNFGTIIETRLQADRGFGFIKLESHEQAAAAICNLNGYMVNGRPIKCSWGKDRPASMAFEPGQTPTYPYSPQGPNSGYPHSGYPQSAGSYNPQFSQYGGMPSPSPGAYGTQAAGAGHSPYGQPQHHQGHQGHQGHHHQSAGGYSRPQHQQQQGQWSGSPGAGGSYPPAGAPTGPAAGTGYGYQG